MVKTRSGTAARHATRVGVVGAAQARRPTVVPSQPMKDPASHPAAVLDGNGDAILGDVIFS